MSENHNERRADSDMRRLYEAIERVGKDCNDQHVETQKTLNDITSAQTVFGVKMQGVEVTLDRIGTKVDTTSERVAATDSTVKALRNQNSTQFDKISELESDINLLSNGSPVSQQKTDNVKWIVGGVLGCCLMVLLAFGAISVQDVKEMNPLVGGK